MSVVITGVEPGSLAEKHHIHSGDRLLSINGHEIQDVLDYRFYIVDERLRLRLEEPGEPRSVTFDKDEYDDPGLLFETYLMDQKHHCRNKCVFCFIDQLPKGLRESLYFKDDDERLSFLMGNYITLTNLGEREVSRIIDLHLSPVNISVHTMNPQLRIQMMGNPHAGEALSILRRLAAAGIAMNCQLVLCPGLNDGGELDFSMRELGALYPAVRSVAAVPVGLTRYREGLAALEPYDQAGAAAVVGQIEAFGDAFLKKNGTRLIYPADEFYLKAGRDIHPPDFYESFAQLENGVGMMSLFEQQFDEALGRRKRAKRHAGERRVAVATGMAAGPFMTALAGRARKKHPGLCCTVYPIVNRFFGEGVTVSGLITGGDLIGQLAGRELYEELLIPANMLRSERDLFLDNKTLEEVERALKVKVTPVENDGADFYSALMGDYHE